MPKEYVRDQYETEPGQCATIDVGWSRNDCVTLGTIVLDAGDNRVREVTSDGMYVALDREGINRLIRILRRARDQAYGLDA